MKKLILLSVCLLSLGLVACGDNSDSSGGGAAGGDNPRNAEMPTVPKCDDFQLYLEKDSSADTNSVKKVSGHKLKQLTQAEINDLLSRSAKWPTNFYKSAPDKSSLYAGALSEAALCAGLNRVNTIRRLSGVQPVSIGAEYTRKAQIAAMMLSLNGNKLVHGFNKYTGQWGMGQKDFEAGNEALGHGNLSNYNLIVSADEWLQERGQGTGSRAGIGHRIWMTAPVAKNFGFGYVANDTNAKQKAFNDNVRGKVADVPVATGSSVLRACDTGNNKEAWDFVAWPAPGYTPLGLFAKSHVANDEGPNIIWTSMWSIYLPSNQVAKIELTNTKTNTKWGADIKENVGNNSNPVTITVLGSDNGYDPKFKVYYGVGPGDTRTSAFSFHPTDTSHVYNDGDTYKVTVTNKFGTVLQSYEYDVTFFEPTITP